MYMGRSYEEKKVLLYYDDVVETGPIKWKQGRRDLGMEGH